jgi:hypothetical protein
LPERRETRTMVRAAIERLPLNYCRVEELDT